MHPVGPDTSVHRPYAADMVGPNAAEPSDRHVVVFGTRPEAVKLAPVIEALDGRAFVVHTGQHYDAELAGTFGERIGLAPPSVQFQIGGARRSAQVGAATRALVELLGTVGARSLIVQGDTNSALAGALAAHRLSIPLVHVEAGLRSNDRAMPEEHNRIVIDHLSALACAPTQHAADTLRSELDPNSATDIVVTGNTVVDALLLHPPLAHDIEITLARHGLRRDGFVLATLHRPENVDDVDRLHAILDVLASAPDEVVLPLHPRTRRLLGDLDDRTALRVVDPLHHHEFLALLAACAVCVSDSGGIQEEVSVLKRPVIVVRRSTERPEVLGSFATLTPTVDKLRTELKRHLHDVAAIRERLRDIPTPYGDGHAGEHIAAAIEALPTPNAYRHH
jgi:UDP-N-acetylglucosamine 2-epimerase (non-hydrolysing)